MQSETLLVPGIAIRSSALGALQHCCGQVPLETPSVILTPTGRRKPLLPSALPWHSPDTCSLARRLRHTSTHFCTLLLASAGLAIRASVSHQAPQPGSLGMVWHTGARQTFQEKPQEEGPRLVASGAETQPDVPSSAFSLASPCISQR